MPVSKSAIKEMRKNIKKRLRNKSIISAMKSLIKKIRKCKSKEEALKLYPIAVRQIDKGITIIHKNKANRIKSRLSKFIDKL